MKGTKGKRSGNKEAGTLKRALSSRMPSTFSERRLSSQSELPPPATMVCTSTSLCIDFWLPLCCVLFCFSSFPLVLVYRFVFAWFQLNQRSSFVQGFGSSCGRCVLLVLFFFLWFLGNACRILISQRRVRAFVQSWNVMFFSRWNGQQVCNVVERLTEGSATGEVRA